MSIKDGTGVTVDDVTSGGGDGTSTSTVDSTYGAEINQDDERMAALQKKCTYFPNMEMGEFAYEKIMAWYEKNCGTLLNLVSIIKKNVDLYNKEMLAFQDIYTNEGVRMSMGALYGSDKHKYKPHPMLVALSLIHI